LHEFLILIIDGLRQIGGSNGDILRLDLVQGVNIELAREVERCLLNKLARLRVKLVERVEQLLLPFAANDQVVPPRLLRRVLVQQFLVDNFAE
jgi:hypothetical protein